MDFRIVLFFSFVLSLIFILSETNAVFVNEFMPDPDDTCKDCSEWMELASIENETLEHITLDTGKGPILLNTSIRSGEFIIITRNKSVFSEIWALENITIIENNKIGLSNAGGNITLYNYTNEIQRISYSASKNNISYGICDGLVLPQNISTPGSQNLCKPEGINETNETKNNCNVSLSIEAETLFADNEKMNYFILINDESCIEKEMKIEYSIEDLFGKIIKPKYNTTQNVTCSKNITREWTTNQPEGTEAYYIKAFIAETGCNDSDFSDNQHEKIIVVKGREAFANSSISITGIDTGSDGEAKFGDILEVKMDIYKGDTNKNAISIWLENTAKQKAGKTDMNLYTKFSNYTISMPIQIYPNCDGHLPEGTYFLKVDGLDTQDEKGIFIEGISGSLCKTTVVENQKPCSCSSCPPCNVTAKNEMPNKYFQILACPEEIAKNMELLIEILLNNTERGNYMLYSYIYDGQKPLSMGFDGKKWLNTWSANKKELYVNGTAVVTLKNRIANDTEIGKYKLRVKILHNGNEEEITRDITIINAMLPLSQKTENETATENNETYGKEHDMENKSVNTTKIPTGGFVSKKEGNWFSDAINNLINFFKNLFRL
jgi:hypothetical protein